MYQILSPRSKIENMTIIVFLNSTKNHLSSLINVFNISLILLFIILIFCSKTFCFAIENSSKLYEVGAQQAKEGKIDEAIVTFKKVIELSPHYILGHYGLGKAYLYKKEMLKEAVFHLKIATELDKTYAKAYFYLGMAYFFSLKYVYALHAYEKAYKLDNTLIECLYNISVIYDIIDDKFKSKEYYKKYQYEKTREEDDSPF